MSKRSAAGETPALRSADHRVTTITSSSVDSALSHAASVPGTGFLIRATRFLVCGNQVSGGGGPGFWFWERGFWSAERGFWFGRTRFLVRGTRFLVGATRFLVRSNEVSGSRNEVSGSWNEVSGPRNEVSRPTDQFFGSMDQLTLAEVSKFKPYRANLGGKRVV